LKVIPCRRMSANTLSDSASSLRKFINQNGVKPVFWRMLNAFDWTLHSRLENLRYYLLSRHDRTVEIKVSDRRFLMALNSRDKGLSKELSLYGFREPHTTRLMSTIIKDDDIIIDVGANIGYYALLESKLAPNGFVYAIEPVRDNFDYLKTNVDVNRCTNVELFNCALSDKRGTGVIFIPERRNCASLVEPSHDGTIRKESVQLETLDSFVKGHVERCPTLVRMDVEGCEYQVIKGALRVLKKSAPLKIVAELHPSLMSERAYDDMLSTLEAQGFKASSFHDPVLSHMKREQIINKLRERAHIKVYGFLGEGYHVLHELKEEHRNYAVTTLFAREET
jgi:FkbM family methyltransferase